MIGRVHFFGKVSAAATAAPPTTTPPLRTLRRPSVFFDSPLSRSDSSSFAIVEFSYASAFLGVASICPLGACVKPASRTGLANAFQKLTASEP